MGLRCGLLRHHAWFRAVPAGRAATGFAIADQSAGGYLVAIAGDDTGTGGHGVASPGGSGRPEERPRCAGCDEGPLPGGSGPSPIS
ncbi:hypothetical protein GCM10010211_57680 [Streptomyces albospinus]|uniref:Uncharacterized protein n=1 Tax=Streptomyces albospinus TaxID=285515 RepID=A0ABQ2VF89_9ACTN|nr:hypothetical protein GCM10010211_57680 [Streptomyces albospinus]